jgi:hypothetical protein
MWPSIVFSSNTKNLCVSIALEGRKNIVQSTTIPTSEQAVKTVIYDRAITLTAATTAPYIYTGYLQIYLNPEAPQKFPELDLIDKLLAQGWTVTTER